MSSLAMSRAEREAFLAAPHVAVVSVADSGRGPLTVPVWYRYEPGGAVRFVTGTDSRKAQLMRSAGRIGFCVQTETAPYQYVSIEGPVTFGEPDPERDVRDIAIRYLGKERGEMYLAMTAADPIPSVLVILKPERWYSVDYSKLG
jgi:nitroimidazol reductase NimA-like FMN-containing flavoprotein (pyridoxamine 5'-phosphate oxidase superfamily)